MSPEQRDKRLIEAIEKIEQHLAFIVRAISLEKQNQKVPEPKFATRSTTKKKRHILDL